MSSSYGKAGHNSLWNHLIFLSLFALLLLALPGTAASEEGKSCKDVCTSEEFGLEMDETECMEQCQEMVAGSEGKINALCWVKLFANCRPRGMAFKTFVYSVLDCAEDGFSENCVFEGVCDACTDCMHAICKCGQNRMPKRECVNEWEDLCSHVH